MADFILTQTAQELQDLLTISSGLASASSMSFTPNENIVAVNFQTAIVEVSDKSVRHSLAIAENDVLVGAPTPFGSWIKKTISEFKTILGLGSAAYTASTAYDIAGAATGVIASSISDGDTTHAPDGNSVFDALAGKQATGLSPLNSQATAENDFLLGAPTPFGTWVKKTLAETKAILDYGLFEIDIYGALMPKNTVTSDPYFELDINGAIMPKAV